MWFHLSKIVDCHFVSTTMSVLVQFRMRCFSKASIRAAESCHSQLSKPAYMFSLNICLFNSCLPIFWSSRLDSILPYLSMAVNAVSLLRVSDSGLSPSRLMEASHLVSFNKEKLGSAFVVASCYIGWNFAEFHRCLALTWGGRSGQLEVGRVV